MNIKLRNTPTYIQKAQTAKEDERKKTRTQMIFGDGHAVTKPFPARTNSFPVCAKKHIKV